MQSRIRQFSFQGLAFLLALSLHGNQGEPVTGRVSDASNAPIFGATITLQMIGRPAETFSTRTNKDGIYQFPEVPDGNYSIEAGLKGHITVRYSPIRVRYPFGYERDFRLPADEIYETDVADKAHVAGELRLAEKPLAGARVCLRNRSEETCTVTNRLGQYSLLVRPGRWQAVVRQRDHETVWRQSLSLPKPGEYRDHIQIRIVAGHK